MGGKSSLGHLIMENVIQKLLDYFRRINPFRQCSISGKFESICFNLNWNNTCLKIF